jgi:hypothetical protein
MEAIIKALFVTAALMLSPASASAMPTGDFIARWRKASSVSRAEAESLSKDRGNASPELQGLLAEFGTATHQYQNQILSARANGTAPRACPTGTIDLTVDGVIADLQKLPSDWLRRELADSFAEVMDHRYPCSAGKK